MHISVILVFHCESWIRYVLLDFQMLLQFRVNYHNHTPLGFTYLVYFLVLKLYYTFYIPPTLQTRRTPYPLTPYPLPPYPLPPYPSISLSYPRTTVLTQRSTHHGHDSTRTTTTRSFLGWRCLPGAGIFSIGSGGRITASGILVGTEELVFGEIFCRMIFWTRILWRVL